ncbi:MAG: carboxypeptidase-like regulatory domain-containing protein [Gemmatimonadota bacterium]
MTAVSALSCANELPPPGSGSDFQPPRIDEIYPAVGDVVAEFSGSARIRFDEPLRDPNSVARLVTASPAFRYEFKAKRNGVDIKPRNGWRVAVYTIRLAEGVRDMLGNQTKSPIEMLFSTGPEISSTAVSGVVYDRETVRPLRDARILFLAADTVPYTAVTSAEGKFDLSHLPPDTYRAIAFLDQNRNLRPDRGFEPLDSTVFALNTPDARVVDLELWVVPPDSTPPVLLEAESRDSLTIRVTFDDYLDPEQGRDSVRVAVTSVERGDTIVVEGLLVADQPAPRPAEQDSAVVEEEPAEAAEPPVPLENPEGDPEMKKRPYRSAILSLGSPLSPGEYEVSVSSFQNLVGLSGGGEASFEYVAPEVAPELPPEVAPDGAPEVAPDDAPEVGPNGAPEIVPDTIPAEEPAPDPVSADAAEEAAQ